MKKIFVLHVFFIAVCIAWLSGGCATARRRSGAPSAEQAPAAAGTAAGIPHFVHRPVVAVSALENRAGFSGSWKLEDGMTEEVVTRLVQRGKVLVVDPREAGGVLTTITRQARGFFRAEGRTTRERPLAARYQIRGAVTDFSVAPDDSGWFRNPGETRRGRGTVSRVAVQLWISDTETGQIFGSVREEEQVSSRSSRTVPYRDIPFGSDAFFATPLGRATSRALDRAIAKLLAEFPATPWIPRVAEGGIETAHVNGGMNVGLREGMEFLIRAEGRRITDPQTGDLIDIRSGPIKGRLRIIEVRPMSATALVLEGDAGRGDHLEPVLR